MMFWIDCRMTAFARHQAVGPERKRIALVSLVDEHLRQLAALMALNFMGNQSAILKGIRQWG
jgi:hypothetical protein